MSDFSITTDAYDYNGAIEPRLAVFHAAGFRYVHWCERWAEYYVYSDGEMARIGRALADAGLRLLDTHNAHDPASARIDDADAGIRAGGLTLLRNRMALTATLGGDCLVVHPPKGDEQPELRFPRFIDSLHEVEADCRQAGVRLAVENMASLRGPLARAYDPLFAEFAPDVLGFCFDSGHANMAGDLAMLDRYGARLIALHLHDNFGATDEHALPGRGTVDWPYIVGALKRLGYAKPVNLEVGLKSQPGLSPAAFVQSAYDRAAALFGVPRTAPVPPR
jgi:sugar phosphate isomerase/epimerase